MSFTELSHATRKARKEHRCEWCGEKIEKGQDYFNYTGIGDGGFQDNKVHLECLDAMQEHFKYNTFDDEFMPYQFKRGSTEER